MSTSRPEWLARILAAPGFLLPALTYLALALFPSLWAPESRGQLVAQFFIIEICAGMLVGALCRLATDSAPWVLGIGRWIVLLTALAGLLAIVWTTRSLGIAVLIAIPVLPRVIEAFRLARRSTTDETLCIDGIISLGGTALIGFPYLFLHTPAPDGPPDVLSVPPPLGLTATAMALHYLVLAYATGKPRRGGAGESN